MPHTTTPTVRELARSIYPTGGDDLADALEARIAARPRPGTKRSVPDSSEALLITYADSLRCEGEHPLATLRAFLAERVAGLPVVHLLPFFPYSSDDGFSVIDYLEVDPRVGNWGDVAALAGDRRLMFDAVVNHVSAKSAWFAKYLAGEPGFERLAVEVDPATDLSAVVRPRALPLLTPFETSRGTKHIWTTFSDDQIDLNFAAPEVTLAVIDVLLAYVDAGASYIRLDAIAFIWKEIGTGCMSLPETHAIVQLMRAVLDEVAPHVTIITETNVPHEENISYFGDGRDEAQLVYNFALPPLVLHTIGSGDATALAGWASTLATPGDETWFFNFLASHDGVGVRGVETILDTAQKQALADRAIAHGGLVGWRNLPDGSKAPYELNINYFDALSDPASDEDQSVQVARFVCAHSIMMTLPGVPGVYVHSLLGSRGDREAALTSGINRAINRAKLDVDQLCAELDTEGSLRQQVFRAIEHLLAVRGGTAALAPSAPHEVLASDPGLFVVRRDARLVCVHNVTAEPLPCPVAGGDLLTGTVVSVGDLVPGYGVLWLA